MASPEDQTNSGQTKAWSNPMETSHSSLDTQDPRLITRGRKVDYQNGSDTDPLDQEQLRQLSLSPFSEFVRPSQPRPRSTVSGSRPRQPGPTNLTGRIGSALHNTWLRHRAVLLMLLAQFFGVTMNMCARILEHEEEGAMHPTQLLFVRMAITVVFANLYMWWAKTPDAPFGKPGVRWLLLARGVTGFFGIYGMWYSIMYLPLAEATVITFLVPCVTGYLCHLVIHEPFTRKEQVASFIALIGVVLIARPAALLGVDEDPSTAETSATGGDPGDEITPAQRLGAIAAALVGVLGTAGAFLSIRHIGPRAHPLVSVNYFSVFCTAVCAIVLVFAPILNIGQPDLRFELPQGAWQWFLLTTVCICGFLTQFLLTASLGGGEKSNRATAMVYTGMLFASAFDKWVFGIEMGMLSVVGCGLIIGSAMWAALSKKEPVPEARADDIEAVLVSDDGDAEVVHLLDEDDRAYSDDD
ncbi:hypothetical protein MGG_03957 [Pyricularia oryzae 70-15]|uniref:EamA domain-containing protein n=3 Tax=Pyricularia oryzae TaxID=318829 RepID=G4NH30_PYRO7|nr:uncharacterized protein MGG_03957 [Pyricularia oryzae 70-15]EHA47540.1 hypothetical protein MGG_03957 [Pyricularia oryzae 70-15]ELQ39086.1 hypothetical protein OOU_Y34scaffold00514g3 [Pyricularia oryzae Y34]KAI7932536.1 hypothetical protein M0657_000285 [Pyricularia oryzae]